MKRVSAAAFLAGVLVAVTAVLSTTHAQSLQFGVTDGVLTACRVSTDGFTVTVRSEDAEQVTSVSDPDIAPTSADYRRVVGEPYFTSGPCPVVGTRVKLTACGGCRNQFGALETGGSGTAFDDNHSAVWAFRRYLDLGEARSVPAQDATVTTFMVSSVLARRNRADGGNRTIWLRGPGSFVLDAYQSEAKAKDSIEMFGPRRPWLRDDAVPLTRIFRTSRDRLLLVSSLPFMPPDPRSSPFVGYWGGFAEAVYRDDGNGKLVLIYSSGRSH